MRASSALRALHRAALAGEALVDRFRGPREGTPLLEPYFGHAEGDGLRIRGRVLTRLRRSEPRPDQSRLANLRQMLALFLTSEVEGVAVRAGPGVISRSDEEGYLDVTVPRGDTAPGWTEVPVSVAGSPEAPTAFPVLVPHPEARFGVISDIDDTMMETGAYSLARNLWTTLTGSAATRRVFPDAVALMARLTADGRTPVFFVSSSPWNLHAFLEDVLFTRAGLPRGPVFLRDLGLSRTKFVTAGHGNHKGAAIDRILAANPRLPFVLIGDTGQHDAAIYRAAAERHPGCVAGVILREPGRGADATDRAEIARLAARGIAVHHGPDYRGVAPDFPPLPARAGV